MIYEIKTKSDLITGATLLIAMPEDDLDKKALYTIQTDKPEFILPFCYRSVDGKVEFVYQIGLHSRLQYFAGSRSSKEYADLWSGILNPLFSCDDWFMKPYSFVLSSEYLYFDKKSKTVRYVYIPSISDCSNQGDLKEMAVEVSKMIAVDDINLENKILRTIVKNFNPQDFLQMLNRCSTVSHVKPNEKAEDAARLKLRIPDAEKELPAEADAVASPYKESAGDIIIDIPEKRSGTKRRRESENGGDVYINSETKPPRKTGSFGSLLGLKKESLSGEKSETASSYSDPSASSASGQTAGNEQGILLPAAAPDRSSPEGFSDETQSIFTGASGVRLHCVGRATLPVNIDVRIDENAFFSIGRYDSAVGRQQSSFEFNRNTKAVSRRHAVIERDTEGYSIIDLASNAGTFVNGNKLPPNTRCKLEQGCRISFGNSGTDYVWEE